MAGSALNSTTAAADFTRRLVARYGTRQPVGGAASATLIHRLTETYGERATDSFYERGFYTRDVAPLPTGVDWLLQTMPDVIVRPRETEEVANIVRLALDEGVAITVRAGASTSLSGSVPVRGGVVLDMSDLKGVVDIDSSAMTVRIRSGTVWTDLERELARHGFAPMSVPSSAPASTVGGWLCTGGYGIGSLKYGPLESQVRSIEVVLPDGQVRRLTCETDPPVQWFAASEGTLGVVTEVELTVREIRPMRHAVIACSGVSAAQELTHHLLAGPTPPYSVHVDDREVLGALAALGFASSEWEGGELVRVDWEGPDAELDASVARLGEVLAAVPGTRLLPSAVALDEWRERFRALRVKQGGPSVIGAEILLPLLELGDYLRDIARLARRQRTRLMSYGHLASTQTIIMMTMYYGDESRAVRYLLDLGLVKKLHDVGAAHGGVPYGLGFWNTPHLRPQLMSVSLDELRRRKCELDPAGIMNPGKSVARLAVMNPAVMRLGMGAVAAVRRVVRRVSR